MQLILPIVNTNKTVLSMTAAEVTALTNLVNSFTTQLTAYNNAKLTAKAARVTKDEQKEIARDALMGYVAKWRANLAVPDALLAQLLVAPHNSPGSSSAPVTPTDFLATGMADGTVELKWKRGGNRGSTTFIVEYKSPSATTWKTLAIVGKTRYEATAPVGVPIQFRITAQKSDDKSTPTAPQTVWANGNNLALAA